MGFPLGIDFRNTSGYVTDPANCFFDDGATNYPHTDANGNVWGWSGGNAGSNNLVVYSGDQAKLSGVVANLAGSGRDFRIDLPASGTYSIRLAEGCASGSGNTAGPVGIYDNATLLGTPITEHDSITGPIWYDATNTAYTTPGTWVSSNTAASFTFASTILKIHHGTNTTGYWLWAHVWIEAAGGSGSVLAGSADSSASFSAQSTAASSLSAAADSSAAFTGQSTVSSVLAGSADSSASFVGASDAAAVWSAAADSTGAFVGSSVASGAGVLSGTGDSSGIFVGSEIAASVLSSVGDSSGIFVYASNIVPTGIPGGKGDSFDNEETMRYFAQRALEAKFARRDEQDVEDAMRVMMKFLTERRP